MVKILEVKNYFIIFQFFLSAFCCIYYCFVRKWRSLLEYVMLILSGIGCAILYYPVMLKHIFEGYRGTEAFSNLVSEQNNLGALWGKVNAMLFNSWGEVFVLLIIVGLFLAIGKNKLVIEFTTNKTLLLVLTMIFCIVGYGLIISKVAPYADVRYIMVIVPMIIGVFVWALSYGIGLFTSNQDVNKFCISGLMILLAIFAYRGNQVQYLYNDNKNDYLSNEYEKKDVIVVYDEATKWKLNSQILLDLQSFSRVYFLPEERLSELEAVCQDCINECAIILEKSEKEQTIIGKLKMMKNSSINSEETHNIGGTTYHIYDFIK